MDIEIGDNVFLKCRITAAGAGLQSALEIHGLGSIKYLGNFRRHTDKYFEYPVVKNLVEYFRERTDEITDLVKGKSVSKDIEYGSFVISWERDCYILKHRRGNDGQRVKNIAYHGKFALHHALASLIDYDFAASGATSEEEAKQAIMESADRVIELIKTIEFENE